MAAERARNSSSTAPVLEYAQQRLTGNIPYVIPTSPVFDLMGQKAGLIRAIRNRKLAEGVLIQPNMIVSVERMRFDYDKLQHVSTRDLALTADTTEALMAVLDQEQLFNRTQWEEYQAAHDEMIHPPGLVGRNAQSITQVYRDTEGNPHPHDNIYKPPVDGARVTHVHTPSVLTNPEELADRYKQAVAEAMGLGGGILEQFLGGTRTSRGAGQKPTPFLALGTTPLTRVNVYLLHAGSTAAHETPAERYLQHIIQTARNWTVSFFSQLYSRLMYAMDMRAIDDTMSRLEQRQFNRRAARLALREIQQALAREMDVTEVGELSLSEKQQMLTEALTRTKSTAKQTKMTIRRWRERVEMLRTRPDAIAKLVFQPGTTERSRQQLQILVESLFPLGLVTAETMEPFARDVFGPGFALEKAPEAPLKATTALSPGDELKAKTQVETSKISAKAKRDALPIAPSAKEPEKKRARTSKD